MYGPIMVVLCIKKITKFLYTKNKWHWEIMEKSWVNFVKCLLDRLYKLCLPYLFIYLFIFFLDLFQCRFFFFFFRILSGRASLISSNWNLFLSNVIFLLITCFTHKTFTKKNMFFQNNKLPFVAAIISIIKSIIFIWKWIIF